MITVASGRTRLRLARDAHHRAELVVVVVIGLALLATMYPGTLLAAAISAEL
jgi:hypothetical protein